MLRGCLRNAFCSSELRRCTSLTGVQTSHVADASLHSSDAGLKCGAHCHQLPVRIFFWSSAQAPDPTRKNTRKTPPQPLRPGVSAQGAFFFFASLRTKTLTGSMSVARGPGGDGSDGCARCFGTNGRPSQWSWRRALHHSRARRPTGTEDRQLSWRAARSP